MSPPTRDIVLASNNPGKISEINRLLEGQAFNVLPQKAFTADEAVEDGLSFVENAIKKARFAALASGLPAIADDSGIEVDALNGAPGIYSARFASEQVGEQASDQANLEKLLADMAGVEESQRTARFQCLMVFLRHADDPVPLICQGTWEGRILTAPRGNNGFGYDPVFFVPSEDKSAAELGAERKGELSHRGQALRQLVVKLTA